MKYSWRSSSLPKIATPVGNRGSSSDERQTKKAPSSSQANEAVPWKCSPGSMGWVADIFHSPMSGANGASALLRGSESVIDYRAPAEFFDEGVGAGSMNSSSA